MAATAPPRARRPLLSARAGRIALLAAVGPGLVVMLADTDAGSLITAAQSGARWGYEMVVPQLALIPVLYVVQDMAVRLGVGTGTGYGGLIRRRFGPGWALVAAVALFASAIGALITDMAAVAGVGELFGISRWVSVPAATAFLVGLAVTGSYRRVERIGIALGLTELVFIPAMLFSGPSGGALVRGLSSFPLGNGSYLYLLAANVGAVVMPWMIVYQQGAVIQQGLSCGDLRGARAGTAAGAVLTQLVMIAVVITLAATVGRAHSGQPLRTVGQIAGALGPFLGAGAARIIFGLGMLGAALVAALVASLAGAWGLSEIVGWKHSLSERPGRDSAGFYLTYVLAHVAGAVLVLASVNLISLAVGVEVMNALLLPVVLGFLLLLEATALPAGQRMRGWYRYAAWALCLAVIGFALLLIPVATRLLSGPRPAQATGSGSRRLSRMRRALPRERSILPTGSTSTVMVTPAFCLIMWARRAARPVRSSGGVVSARTSTQTASSSRRPGRSMTHR